MKRLLVLLMAVSLIAGFAVTAMATDWSFYGSARMSTFYNNQDDTIVPPDGKDWTTWDLQGNARIGANVSGSPIGGRFEYGSGPNLRLLYGTYNFGFGGQILIGQNYTPTSDRFYSNQVYASDEDLLGVGAFYAGRTPCIEFNMKGFEIAMVRPNDGGNIGLTIPDAADPTKTKAAGTDIAYPKVELKYNFTSSKFFFDIFGGFQTYEVEADKVYDVTSYVGGAGAGVNIGPAYIRGSGFWARNHGNYGAYNPWKVPTGAKYSTAKKDIIDNNTIGALAVVGAKAGDMVTFEAGGGYQASEYDEDGADKDETISYYLQATINIAPGFFIVPEVGVVDYSENAAGADQGKLTYAGAKWQINF